MRNFFNQRFTRIGLVAALVTLAVGSVVEDIVVMLIVGFFIVIILSIP